MVFPFYTNLVSEGHLLLRSVFHLNVECIIDSLIMLQ